MFNTPTVFTFKQDPTDRSGSIITFEPVQDFGADLRASLEDIPLPPQNLKCSYNIGCKNESPPAYQPDPKSPYLCTFHYRHPLSRKGGDPRRFRCRAIIKDRSQCKNHEYKHLCPEDNEMTFRCIRHATFQRGALFRQRRQEQRQLRKQEQLHQQKQQKQQKQQQQQQQKLEYDLFDDRQEPEWDRGGPAPSEDITVQIRVGAATENNLSWRTVIPGWRFDELTFNYDPLIKDEIRKVIQDYFRFLRMARASDLEEGSKEWVQYRAHLANGHVYLLCPHDRSESAMAEDEPPRPLPRRLVHKHGCSNGGAQKPPEPLVHDGEEHAGEDEGMEFPIKIGYASNIKRRVASYRVCSFFQGWVVYFNNASTMTKTHGTYREPLVFVHLLEQILHRVWIAQQSDFECLCGITHIEFFWFKGPKDKTFDQAFDTVSKRMAPHIMRWIDVMKSLKDLYEEVCSFHGVHPDYRH
ncbi:hypothetical protein EDD11_003374 [Mortierella claussenii]|nr:hypothetical protein EDD11_003374 [Mortierella claussenii]